jgi:hypothetical protein
LAAILAKIARACELWDDGENALAYIHLAHVGLPLCDEEQALRLFIANGLLESGVTPAALMRAQGFDAAPLPLSKYPGQPRMPAGNGRAIVLGGIELPKPSRCWRQAPVAATVAS